MPSTAVAAAKNSWKRIKHKYKVKDAGKMRAREIQKMEKLKRMAQNKANRPK